MLGGVFEMTQRTVLPLVYDSATFDQLRKAHNTHCLSYE